MYPELSYSHFSPGLNSSGLSLNSAIRSGSFISSRTRRYPLRQPRVARDAGGMGEQVLDGDLLSVRGIVRQVLRDLVLDPQLPPLLKQQDGGGGELLGDRAQLEHHLRRYRSSELQVRHAKPLAQHGLAVFDDQSRGAWLSAGYVVARR